jgi:hypothetical protein
MDVLAWCIWQAMKEAKAREEMARNSLVISTGICPSLSPFTHSICVYAYVYVYVQVCACDQHVCMRMCRCMLAQSRKLLHLLPKDIPCVCMFVGIYVGICVRVHVCMFICTHIYTCTWMLQMDHWIHCCEGLWRLPQIRTCTPTFLSSISAWTSMKAVRIYPSLYVSIYPSIYQHYPAKVAQAVAASNTACN